jgi:hypothetical protein
MSRSVPAYPPASLPSVHPQGTWAEPGGPQDEADPLATLTALEARAVWAYMGEARGNASHALAIARGEPLAPGERANESLRSSAHALFTRSNVAAAVASLLRTEGMSRVELLHRVADHARGVPADCWVPTSDGTPGLDLARLKEHGLAHLVVGFDAQGRAKLADPLRAAELLARLAGYLSPDVSVGVRIDVSGMTTDQLRAMVRTGCLNPDRV